MSRPWWWSCVAHAGDAAPTSATVANAAVHNRVLIFIPEPRPLVVGRLLELSAPPFPVIDSLEEVHAGPARSLHSPTPDRNRSVDPARRQPPEAAARRTTHSRARLPGGPTPPRHANAGLQGGPRTHSIEVSRST